MICHLIEFMKNGFQAHGPIEFARSKESGQGKAVQAK
jgi:hypothetical protein